MRRIRVATGLVSSSRARLNYLSYNRIESPRFRLSKSTLSAIPAMMLAMTIMFVSEVAQASNESLTVDTLIDEFDGDISPGDVSLREAISFVDAGGAVHFSPGLSGGTIELILGQLEITKDLSINGLGPEQIAVSGGNAFRVFRVDDGDDLRASVVVIDGLTIKEGRAVGGNVAGDGAGVFNAENLTLANSVVSNNESTNVSGGVFNNVGGNIVVRSCQIIDNVGPFGAGFRNYGTAKFIDSTISGNVATGFGGGVDNFGGFLKIIGTTISGNSAEFGGGIGVGGAGSGRVVILDSTVAENAADTGAGIIANDPVEIANSHIKDNSARLGGALYVGENSDALLKNCAVYENTANTGGGILNSGLLTLIDTTIEGNSALGGSDSRGGGVSNGNYTGSEPGGTVFVRRSDISRNVAGVGGGFFNRYDGDLTIIGSAVDGNEAVSAGGGGIDSDGVVTITNATVSRNTSAEDGGIDSSEMLITNSTVSGNVGSNVGGIDSRAVTIVNSIVAGNTGGRGNDCTGTLTSQGNNLIGDGTACDVVFQSSDLTGDPGLGGFVDRGQPGSGHFPILPTSQAIDAGNDDVCPPEDQLGSPRVDGNEDGRVVCDIGAIEFQGDAPAIEVAIDIKPGDKTNSINPRKRGGVWVAVLAAVDAENEFDPSSEVDIPTVKFGRDEARARDYKLKDLNKDGILDLLFRFKVRDTGIVCGDTQATLSGNLFAGSKFSGTDTVKTVGCRDAKKAVEEIWQAIHVINSLDQNSVKHRKLLTRALRYTIWQIKNERYGRAKAVLTHHAIPRIDGCGIKGHPDKNDWIRSCSAQSEIEPLLRSAVAYL